MERGVGSEQGSPESEMGDGDNDSVDCGAEMEVDAANGSAEGAAQTSSGMRAGAYDGVEPFEGMEFDDEEEAWTFYNAYAHRVGFSTRISVMHRSRRDGSIMSRQFVCAKEGFRTYRGKSEGGGGDDGRGRRTRAVTRVGCKAMIRVKKQENGRWTVTKLETTHNHALVPPNQAHCLRPHKPLSECGKQRTFSGHRNGSALLAIEPPQPLSPPVRDASLAPVVPEYIIDGVGKGTRVILDYVRRMQAEDPAFYYAVQFVEGHPVGNVFWADARARMAYKEFGDAIILDDHCKRSKYEVPLVTFTGINHHCQPILFGCAVIVDNSDASLVWLFEMLLFAMSGQHPASLTTEHDNVVQSAVLKVLPQTRHRFCKWHIVKEAQDKLLPSAFPSFHKEFSKCIDMSETPDEFEANWKALISKFAPGNNEWLDSIYNCRQQWVPVYLRDTFFGDVPSAQECASRSSFFEGYISAKTALQSFIQQYEKALDCCYEKEVKEEFDTKYSLPDIKTSSPIEKQGAELYTRVMFLKFQQQLIDASLFTAEMVEEEGSTHTYKVTKSKGSDKAHIVDFNSSESSVKCSCQMFEYSSIVCRHILTVLGARGISALPLQYIVKRWTKNAVDRSSEKKDDAANKINELKEEQRSVIQDGQQSPTWRYNSLCREAIRFAEEGASSIEIYIVAMQALQEAANKVNIAKRGIEQVSPLAVTPIATQAFESFGKVEESSFRQEKKRKRCSNDPKETSTSNKLMYLQQPINFLFVAPSMSTDSQGPSQLVAAAPLSLSAQCGQTLRTNQSNDGNNTPAFLAVDNTTGLSDRNGSALLPSSGNVMQGGETKYSQIKESGELSQANGNTGSIGNTSSAPSAQLVTVPIGLCVPPMDGSMISAAGMSSGSAISNGNASLGLHQSQPATHVQTRSFADNTDTWANPESSSIRAVAIAAGARIASPSDAATIIKAVQSKGAIRIRPGECPPSYLKPLAPTPLSALPPVDIPGPTQVSSGHMQQPGQCSFGDPTAAKDAIFGSSDGSDDDDYDDDDIDDEDDEGLTGDEVEEE